MIINAAEHGITTNQDVSAPLKELLSEISKISGDKELVINRGTYYLSAENCTEDLLYITNTVGDDEFSADEAPHKARIGLYLKDISDLKISAEGVVFILDGKMTNAALINCTNIAIVGLEIKHKNPDEHEFTVVEKTPFSVDFMLDSESCYTKENKNLFFTGRDFKTDFFENRNATWGWFGKVFADNENHIRRERNPFFAALSIKEISPHMFRLGYLNTSRFTVGETYCVFNTRRQYVGIFISKSKGIVLKHIAQRFNYSLALVIQDSENITVDSSEFSPAHKQIKKLVSIADFMQFCMCRGQITVKNSFFCGAGDDCLNVHGIHFKIIEISDNTLLVRFMHSQTHGFNPLRQGDEIEYVNPATLLPLGKAKILSSELINETDIRVTVDTTDVATTDMVIEDVSACPNLSFTNNKLTRIITRGLLITTRGKTVIEDNNFDNTEMAAILFSDDAKNWYESGRCTDVTIKGNRFGYCGAYNIQILPENGNTHSIVHGSFLIQNNCFEKSSAGGIDANNAQSLTFINNTGLGLKEGFIKSKNVVSLKKEQGNI